MFNFDGKIGSTILCSMDGEIYGVGSDEDDAREDAITNAFWIDEQGESHPVTDAWIDEQLKLGRQGHAGGLRFDYDDE